MKGNAKKCAIQWQIPDFMSDNIIDVYSISRNSKLKTFHIEDEAHNQGRKNEACAVPV